MEIPLNASREEISAFENQVQAEMDRLDALAESWATGEIKTVAQSAVDFPAVGVHA